VGKLGLAGVSLAAAVPGGILFVLLLLAAISHLGQMPMAMKAIAILVMLIGLAMMLFPLYLLIWYRSSLVVLPKDKPTPALAVAGGATAGAGAGALNESFLDDFNASTDDLLADRREEEVFGDEFASSTEIATFDEYSDEGTQEFSGDLGVADDEFPADSSTELSTVEFTMENESEEFDLADDELLPSFTDDDEEVDNGSETELLAGGGLDDDFDFEFFDDDEEKKS